MHGKSDESLLMELAMLRFRYGRDFAMVVMRVARAPFHAHVGSVTQTCQAKICNLGIPLPKKRNNIPVFLEYYS